MRLGGSIRRRKSAAIVMAVVLLGSTVSGAACDGGRKSGEASSGGAPDVLRPGDPDLHTAHLRERVEHQRFERKAAAADSAWRPLFAMTVEERGQLVDGRPGFSAVQRSDTPSIPLGDTLLVRLDGLAPVREWMRTGGTIRRIEYMGHRVRHARRTGDSAEVVAEDSFPVPVFAFNQVNMLVRSLPFRAGYHAILPLYSEGTESLEMDTVDVIGAEPDAAGAADRRWRVRFADAAIVSTYAIDQATRRVVDYRVRQRKSGTLIRLVPSSARPTGAR
jgi:hypothetical protein